MEIPAHMLSEEVLAGIIKDFVLREGTDYGTQEYGLSEKIAQVKRQIDQGKVVVVFDAEDESCSLAVRP